MPMGCGWLEYPKTEDYQLIAAGGAAGSAERGLMVVRASLRWRLVLFFKQCSALIAVWLAAVGW